jgi:hypothetical protein
VVEIGREALTTDKSQVLAAERQQPYTAAEQAAADGRQAEYTRDVPRTCICPWQFSRRQRRYTIISEMTGCPWHGHGQGDNDDQ